MSARCEECGSDDVHVRTTHDGAAFTECGLCGALAGPAEVVEELQLRREADARGREPNLHALASWIASQPGLELVQVQDADPALGAFPSLQFATREPAGRLSLENLLASLALGRGQLRLPWIVEAELLARLVFTLKPRVSAGTPAQSAAAVRQAQADLAAIRRNLLRDTGLSWWRRPR